MDLGEIAIDHAGKLSAFQTQWGLDEHCMHFLQKLPEPALDQVIARFDHRPDQTNVSARCFAFARGVLRSHEESEAGRQNSLASFQAKWGLDHRCVEFLASLSPDILNTVMQSFDHRPDQTNVSARCFAFAKKIQQNFMGGQMAQPQLVLPPAPPPQWVPPPAPAYQVVPPPPAPPNGGTKRKWDEVQEGIPDHLRQFQALWDLDDRCIEFLGNMPPDALEEVIMKFNHAPHQTNVSARCVAFAKNITARLGGQAHVPPPVSPLEQFQATWGVDERCMEYISSLPPDVQNQVLAGFSHSPEQTNVSARCFAFARSIVQRVTGNAHPQQQQHHQLHQQPHYQPHQQPQQQQHWQQQATESWSDSWETEQWEVAKPPPVAPPRPPPYPPEAVTAPETWAPETADDAGPLLHFQQRWGLDDKCIEFVASLQPHLQATVLEKFDHRPDQTNASARCFAFAKSVMQRNGQGEAPPQLSMLDQFQQRWGIDERCKDYLASLPHSLQAHVCQSFSHSPEQTNVSARCFAFAKGALNKFGG